MISGQLTVPSCVRLPRRPLHTPLQLGRLHMRTMTASTTSPSPPTSHRRFACPNLDCHKVERGRCWRAESSSQGQVLATTPPSTSSDTTTRFYDAHTPLRYTSHAPVDVPRLASLAFSRARAPACSQLVRTLNVACIDLVDFMRTTDT